MCGVYKPTNVISISYGEAELDQLANYLKRQCNEFMKLGLQSHTIIASSGDYDVAANPGDGGPIGCLAKNQTIFNPKTPA
jgi:tripeptidyl-peptidase I